MWHKVEDKLPEYGETVLAAFKGQFHWVMFTANLCNINGVIRLAAQGYAEPTHWTSLPAAPEES